ncbi:MULTISPECIES: YgfZ/GcvT domain-containing protein [unclassified Brevundimonas]|uniref:CAF17-like 4Fe-4S cluster assembly/insertion protein YgfZ n=1 Tax=unclassified Brevundimonas TaxID=2622653 RepID=UPI0025BDD650|nr:MULTISPECIES: folate-binding protein [unclassified Brevundimonas]
MPIARLNSRAVITVIGPDARHFLNNLLTQNVETLEAGALRFGALLTPQGRLMLDLFLWGKDDGVWLDVPADARDALVQRLNMYKLRADVQITPSDAGVFAAWDEAPEGFSPDPRLEGLGHRAIGFDGATTASEEDWHAHRAALGVVEAAFDAPKDKTYPIEANFDLMNGIDFHKGCFVGQETTSRMKRRGTIKNRILPFTYEGDAPAVGAEVLNGELRAGEVTFAANGRGMAMMRLDRMEGVLTVDGKPVVVNRPDWVPALPSE